MDVAQVLVIREVDQVVGFTTDCDFACFGDLDHDIIGRSFDDIEGENSSNEAGLKLIGPHLNDHVLNRQKTYMIDSFPIFNFDEGTSSTTYIFE